MSLASLLCPSCGVPVQNSHRCTASALTGSGRHECDHGWLNHTDPQTGREYVTRCPICPPAVRSNRKTGGI